MIHKAITLVVAMLGAVVVAQAQPAPHVHRIGILAHDVPPPGLLETFREGLRERGYVEGKNITIALRNAEGKNERLSALVDELPPPFPRSSPPGTPEALSSPFLSRTSSSSRRYAVVEPCIRKRHSISLGR